STLQNNTADTSTEDITRHWLYQKKLIYDQS
ncbi:MAG: hypothetical protein ACI9RZ_000698, partial [Sphingobacteriales bacterium]